MGRWISRKGDRHQHDYPATSSDTKIAVGDVWECACGATFKVNTRQRLADRGEGDFVYLTWTFASTPVNSLAEQRDGMYGNSTYYGPYGWGSQER